MLNNFLKPYCVISLALMYIPSYSALPAGFFETVLAPKATVIQATCMAFSNDGRIFIGEKAGDIKLVKGDSAVLIYHAETNNETENGLLKILAHPKFSQKPWLYLFVLTANRHHHNIIRLTLDANSKPTKIDTITSLALLSANAMNRHNGSGMVFGKDGFLYVARGQDELTEGNNPAAAWDNQRGKILRFTEDGQPAPGNPHYNNSGVSNDEKSIWARGFRNPWSMAVDTISGKIYVGDVGDNTEELNEVAQPNSAKDYWYGYGIGGGDGLNPNGKNTIDPIYYYGTGSNGAKAIVAGVPYNSGINSNWPAEYKNKIYISDYVNRNIMTVPLNNPQDPTDIFDTAKSGIKVFSDASAVRANLYLGPDGNLYFTEYSDDVNQHKKAYVISYGPYKPVVTKINSFPQSQSQSQNKLTPVTFALRAGKAKALQFLFSGTSPFELEKTVTVTIQSLDGKVFFTHKAKVHGLSLLINGFTPVNAGVYLCQFTWESQGENHMATSQIVALP